MGTHFVATSLKGFGFSVKTLSLLLGFSTSSSSNEDIVSPEVTEEIEETNDPEVPGGDPGAPHDCVEEDERPACQVRSRGTEFFAVKLRVERLRDQGNIMEPKCLRPKRGSNRENIPIVLSSCNRTQSRLWKKEFNNRDKGPNKRYRFVNVWSGKCITKVGTELRQRTCSPSGVAPGGPQTFQFRKTPPFGSGDFIMSMNTSAGGGCLQGKVERTRTSAALILISTKVVLTSGSSCTNDAKNRWYQDMF